ncbi:MAG: cytochrome c biogenesis CcdA family protein [Halobacteria archaeon]
MHSPTGDPTLSFAFAAGLASFLSPCVLPVIPAFLAQLGGTTLQEGEVSRRKMFTSSLLFVIGFSLVFAVVGVLLNSVFRSASTEILKWLSRFAGTLIIVFGLQLTGLIELEFLEKERSFGFIDRMGPGYVSSFVFGAAFAIAWTPCVGPLLGSVLSLAVTNPVGAFPLLTTYSLGLGLPFLLVGLFPTEITGAFRSHGGTLKKVQMVFGYVLIALGVLVFTQRLSAVADFGFVNEIVR